jgi:hypothetical protein
LLERSLVGEFSIGDDECATAGSDPLSERIEEGECRAEIDLHPTLVKGWIDEGEIESGVDGLLSGIPPDDSASGGEAEPINVALCTLDRAAVSVDEQDFGLWPECGRGDAENPGSAAEVDDSLGRFVSGKSRECLDQGLAARVELLRAEDAWSCFDLEFEGRLVDGFDPDRESRGRFDRGSRALVLFESHDACPRSIADNDRRLFELGREAFDRGNDAQRIRTGQQELASGFENSPGLLEVREGCRSALLQVDEGLSEALVREFARVGDDVKIAGNSCQIAISPGLNDGSADGRDREVGLEFTNDTLAQYAWVEGKGLGLSVSFVAHGRNIVESAKTGRFTDLLTT